MKNMYESSKIFAAYSTIGFCYYLLEKLHEEITKPKKAIELMIDKATGYDTEKVKQAIKLIEEIIKCKKLVEDETFKSDEEKLKELKAILPADK